MCASPFVAGNFNHVLKSGAEELNIFSLVERVGAVDRELLCLKDVKDSVKHLVASAVSSDQNLNQYRGDTLQLVDLPPLKESDARTNHSR